MQKFQHDFVFQILIYVNIFDHHHHSRHLIVQDHFLVFPNSYTVFLQAKPCKSLWVAGISQNFSKEELEEEFMRFGKIQEFKFLRDRNTAYVDYFRLEDASQALKSMNGKRIGGDQIRVDFLRSQPSRRVSKSIC